MEAVTQFIDALNALIHSLSALVVASAGLLGAGMGLRGAWRAWRRRQGETGSQHCLQASEGPAVGEAEDGTNQ